MRFDPSAAGTRTATITIANNDSDENPYDFTIQGTGTVAPEIDLTGNGVSIADGDTKPTAADHTDFGAADVVAGTVTRTFTIRNTGTGALNLSGSPLVAVKGTNAADFTVTALPTSPVAVGGSTTFQVSFDPRAAGKRVAALVIANDDANESPYNFAIQGTGTTPEINLSGNGVNIADGDTSPAAADHTDFGRVDVGAGTVTRTFTIRNTGTDALILSGTPRVAVSGANAADFTVTALPPSSIAAAISTIFQVRFDPSAAGTRVATLTIANNDANENPFNFAIRGTGRTTSADELPAATAAVAETLTKPPAPSGPTNLFAGAAYSFSTQGAISNHGDEIQYRFSWSDGTTSDWLPVGVVGGNQELGRTGDVRPGSGAGSLREPPVGTSRRCPLPWR